MKSERENAIGLLLTGSLIHSANTPWQCRVLCPPGAPEGWGTWLARDETKYYKTGTDSPAGIKKTTTDPALTLEK